MAYGQEIRGRGVHIMIFGSLVGDAGVIGGRTEEGDGGQRTGVLGLFRKCDFLLVVGLNLMRRRKRKQAVTAIAFEMVPSSILS
nr:hypothetical protein CFP56_23205 [Quercus suber]